jgi:hypothetical protein
VSDHLPVCGSFHFGQLQGGVEGRRKKYIAKPAPPFAWRMRQTGRLQRRTWRWSGGT